MVQDNAKKEGMPRIKIALPEGGSQWGQTFWRDLVLGCPRRAMLRRQGRGYSTDRNLEVGTIYHALQEQYHTRKEPWEVNDVTYSPQPHDPTAVLEGERLFRAYRARFPPDHMGRVFSVEEPISLKTRNTLGMPAYTARLDRVIVVRKKDIERARRERFIRLTPGYWIVDYKTVAWWNAHSQERYTRDLQFKMYAMAWMLKHPTLKLQGTIVDAATKTNEVKFFALTIRPPNTRDRKIVQAFGDLATASWAAYKDADAMDVPCNPDRCFDWSRICSFLNRPCKRY